MRTSPFIFVPAFALAIVMACGSEQAARPTPPVEPTEPAPNRPVEPPARGQNRARTVYVPAYSHLQSGERRTLLAITLSVRNVDPVASITLSHVDYYDTSGHRVRSYLDAPRVLEPLETAEFSVETLDEAGGSGANFLVYWEGPSDAHPLLTETVMAGHTGGGYLSFTSRGVELARPLSLEDAPPLDPDPAPSEG